MTDVPDAARVASFRPQQPQDHRLFGLIEFMARLGVVAHAAFVGLFLYLDVVWLAVFNVASVAAWVFAAGLNRRGSHDAAITLMAVEAVIHAVLAVLAIGWTSGFAFYLLAVVPAVSFIDRLRSSLLLVLSALLAVLFVALYGASLRLEPVPVSPWLLELMYDANVAIVFAALGIITFHFRRGSDAAERRLAAIAGTDPLTELANRRRLAEIIAIEEERCERGGHALALVLTDVDHFKRVNDEFGHDVGDFVLVNVAARLRDALRQGDHLGRWGGEEFLAVLPETNLSEAVAVAERMREALEQARLEAGAQHIPVTLTLGVAERAPGEDPEATIRRADEALYEGKHAGRNRVVAAAPGEVTAESEATPTPVGVGR